MTTQLRNSGTPVAIIAQIKEVISVSIVTIVWQGRIYEASLFTNVNLTVSVGDAVIAESLPASQQWYLVAKL